MAAVRGPYFPDEEFQTLMGLDRGEVAAVLADWPADRDHADSRLAVSNVLNMLLGYPHGDWDELGQRISATPTDVAAALARWQGNDSTAEGSGPRGHFDRLR